MDAQPEDIKNHKVGRIHMYKVIWILLWKTHRLQGTTNLSFLMNLFQCGSFRLCFHEGLNFMLRVLLLDRDGTKRIVFAARQMWPMTEQIQLPCPRESSFQDRHACTDWGSWESGKYHGSCYLYGSTERCCVGSFRRLLYYGELLSFHVVLNSGYSKT